MRIRRFRGGIAVTKRAGARDLVTADPKRVPHEGDPTADTRGGAGASAPSDAHVEPDTAADDSGAGRPGQAPCQSADQRQD